MISKKTVAFTILAVFFVIADRWLKALSLQGYFDRPFPLVGNFFSLNFAKNFYIAFSIPFSGPILTAIIGIIILILLYYWIKSVAAKTVGKPCELNPYILSLLIIGAALNFADRIEHGFVVDYFYLRYFTVFNLADCLICFSVIWLLFFSFKKNRSAVS